MEWAGCGCSNRCRVWGTLGATIHLEIGDVSRFPSPQHLASYAGLMPRVISSGGKTWHGRTSPQSNHYLRWAFVEAADAILTHRKTYAGAHVIELYDRLKKHKCHGKAAIAVAAFGRVGWWITGTVSPAGCARGGAAFVQER